MKFRVMMDWAEDGQVGYTTCESRESAQRVAREVSRDKDCPTYVVEVRA